MIWMIDLRLKAANVKMPQALSCRGIKVATRKKLPEKDNVNLGTMFEVTDDNTQTLFMCINPALSF